MFIFLLLRLRPPRSQLPYTLFPYTPLFQSDPPAEERTRLLQAVALVHHPEPRARRREAKAQARERAQEKARQTEELLNQTGIRPLRRKPAFSTPTYFPPQPPGPHDPHNRATDPVSHHESPELLHLSVRKPKYNGRAPRRHPPPPHPPPPPP